MNNDIESKENPVNFKQIQNDFAKSRYSQLY